MSDTQKIIDHSCPLTVLLRAGPGLCFDGAYELRQGCAAGHPRKGKSDSSKLAG